MSCCSTASAMGITMAVVDVLLSHMERNTVQHMKPSTNLDETLSHGCVCAAHMPGLAPAIITMRRAMRLCRFHFSMEAAKQMTPISSRVLLTTKAQANTQTGQTHLARLQYPKQRVEEGWDQSSSTEGNGLRHPVDGRHHQHVGAACLLQEEQYSFISKVTDVQMLQTERQLLLRRAAKIGIQAKQKNVLLDSRSCLFFCSFLASSCATHSCQTPASPDITAGLLGVGADGQLIHVSLLTLVGWMSGSGSRDSGMNTTTISFLAFHSFLNRSILAAASSLMGDPELWNGPASTQQNRV
ncbi:hypothetical protein INR49_004113 [Caranx melampygus]|nr:hypothetical protein INR49_004113 [Caranx melampygus]